MNKNSEFIYIMRHPVDRAFSHYGHHMRNGITMTFEEALEKDTIYSIENNSEVEKNSTNRLHCSMYATNS